MPLWLVGGWVRDALLGRTAEDLDFTAGPGTVRLVRRLESSWHRRAFRFRKRGVTTWRLHVDGRDLDVVDAGRRGLDADLARRDFTVNAVAFDLVSGRIRDPMGGIRDLRRGILRLPRPGVVREDPVRALRAARFLAEFPTFRLHPGVRRESQGVARGVRRASVERVRDEMDELLRAADPRRGLVALESLGILDAVIPEIEPMRACPAGRDRPDVWTHTLGALALAARPGRIPGAGAGREREASGVLRWALLLHDVSKPDTVRLASGGRPTFHGHEALGAELAERILRRLRLPAASRKRSVRLVLFHLRPHHLAEVGAPARGMRRLVRESGMDLPLLVLHAACDAKASGAKDAAKRWRRLRPVLLELLAIHGRSIDRPLPCLVTGDDVMAVRGIPPVPRWVGSCARSGRDRRTGRFATEIKPSSSCAWDAAARGVDVEPSQCARARGPALRGCAGCRIAGQVALDGVGQNR